jgi:hypothetical protein
MFDSWTADAVAAGLVPTQEVTVAIEDASVMISGRTAGERLELTGGSRVLVRRAIRFTASQGSELPPVFDSLAEEYFFFDLVAETALASPGPAVAVDVLAGIGQRLCGHQDELRPRLATDEERRLLALPRVSVVLEIARTGCVSDGKPVMVAHQIRRSDGAMFRYDTAYRSG